MTDIHAAWFELSDPACSLWQPTKKRRSFEASGLTQMMSLEAIDNGGRGSKRRLASTCQWSILRKVLEADLGCPETSSSGSRDAWRCYSVVGGVNPTDSWPLWLMETIAIVELWGGKLIVLMCGCNIAQHYRITPSKRPVRFFLLNSTSECRRRKREGWNLFCTIVSPTPTHTHTEQQI